MSETLSQDRSGGNKRVIDYVNASLAKRYAREQRFKYIGLGAVLLGFLFVSVLFVRIGYQGYSAFTQTFVQLEVDLDEQKIDPSGERDPQVLASANYLGIVKSSMRDAFPNVKGRREKRDLYGLVSSGAAFQLRNLVEEHQDLIGTKQTVWVPVDDDVDVFFKGRSTAIDERAGEGIASPVGTDGEIRILSTSNDFAAILADIKQHLGRLARKGERKIRLLEETLPDVVDQTKHLSMEHDLEFERDKFEDLQRRADAIGGEEQLSSEIPSYLIKINGGIVKATSVGNAEILGTVLKPLESTQDAQAGEWEIVELAVPESSRRLKDKEIVWLMDLQDQGRIEQRFNTTLFTAGDSREPELAGVGGAIVGSFLTLMVTLVLSFPIGVAAAVYLEEFAPKNRWTDLIEVNINNLAAVPSIVFGLLGLAVFINFFGLPRSAPLIGGLVLTLMTLPTIIIASRAALKSVPPSIREAALGVGASRMQAMFHHVLPLAMPGMLTGTIIGMAQALGETAPLLMIGMIAFIVDIPGGPLDPSTVLPVQIYLWSDLPEAAYEERAAAAIMILLAFLITMNALAVVLRKKFERRW